jgi:hypothetical protein
MPPWSEHSAWCDQSLYDNAENKRLVMHQSYISWIGSDGVREGKKGLHVPHGHHAVLALTVFVASSQALPFGVDND